jgi:signal transduction histidine kinase
MINESLRRLPLFAELSEADLEWLSAHAEPLTVQPGEHLIEEGEPGEAAYVVLDGEFEIIKKSNRQDIVIAVRDAGEVFGEMALIDQSPRTATVRALRKSSLLRIGGDTFKQLLSQSGSASLSILRTVSRRLRQNEGLVRQNEKMAALGTLAAGLAHELNNPAAAVRRSANQLRTALKEWSTATSELERLSLTDEQTQVVGELKAKLEGPRSANEALEPLAQSDQEYELQTRLEQSGVADAWQMAPTLVANGWEARSVAKLEETFPSPVLNAVLRWLAAGLTVQSLLKEVDLGTERVSEIVKAVKAYSYLDQAPVQEVDIHEGLDNTLIILRHRIGGNIEVVREYAAGLPHIESYGSELNQVWTNLLDNAIYAMEGSGVLRLRTRAEDGHVVVEIQDSGTGIPPDIQQRIFEPFFTTKPPGLGTGLGLHIAYSIINNHYGRISVTSVPGNTCFQVTLPTQLPRAAG